MMSQPYRLLTPADRDSVIDVMSRAFADDPLWVFLVPEPKKRLHYLRKTYRALFSDSLQNDQTYGVGDPLAGVMVWARADEKKTFASPWNFDYLRLLVSPFIFSFVKAFPIFAQFEAMQNRYAPEPHDYLNTIGVAPEAQGTRVGSALMRPFLTDADARSVPVYTETMTPENVPLYEHLGFKIKQHYRVPKTPLSIWALKRPVSA